MSAATLHVSQLLVLAGVVAAFFGCRIALKRNLAAAVVVLPLVALVPWTAQPVAVDPVVLLPLVSAALWALWLLAESMRLEHRLPAGIPALAAAAVASSLAAVYCPQIIIILAAVCLYYALTLGVRRSLAAALVLLVIPVAWRIAVAAPAAFTEGTALRPEYWLETTLLAGWDAGSWYQSGQSGAMRAANGGISRLFYVPLLLPFLALAYLQERQWWVIPTFVWATALVAASVFFAGAATLQYSFALQLGILVPFGLAGVRAVQTPLARPGASTAAP